MSRTTIKDIARVLNINPSTVSRALKDHPDIGKQLKDRIKTIADELGYSPNAHAVGLRKGKAYTIGLIIPEISMYFFPSLIKAVEEVVYEKDYHLMVLHSNEEIKREISNAKICANAGVDGLLVSLTRETDNIRHFQHLQENGLPIVYFDKIPAGHETFNVVIFGDKAAYLAVTYLLELPVVPLKLFGIFGDERLSITKDRLNGFEQAIIDHHFNRANADTCFAMDSDEAAKAFRAIYLSPDRPDALFIMSDETLAGVALVVRELQIRIPADIRVIALSDGFCPGLLSFPLPYIHTSGHALGEKAAHLLFDLIDKKSIHSGTHYIDTPLFL